MDNFITDTFKKSSKLEPKNIEKQIEKFAHNAGESIGNFASDVADTGKEYLKTSEAYVKSNPAKSVAVAAASGMVLGSLLTLAFRKK